ncbi:MAG: FkbM family methyltransferase [Cyanobacteria bacterium P01_C01_bin.120]
MSQKDNDSIVIIGAYDLLSFDCIADMLFGSEKKIFLFEPREKPFNILLSNIEKLNLKNCKCLNLAVHPSLQNLKIYEVEESKVYKYESWISGMASLYKERLLEHAEDSDLKFSQVNCSSPDNWYQDFDIAQISYLQIDTEGFDYEILKSINLAFHTPSVIRLEFVNLGKEDQEYVLQYLTDFGYDLMFNGEDLIAVNLRKLI